MVSSLPGWRPGTIAAAACARCNASSPTGIRPRRRARRRIETPPGAQAQVDWAQFPRMLVAGEPVTLHAFHLVLSHSRFGAVVWMPAQDSLCWLAAHNAAFERVGGIPAVLRVDNTKTAVVRGAGRWGSSTTAIAATPRRS